MAWEDRTPAEKRAARKADREAARIDAADGNRTYVVTLPHGTRITVQGITSAKAVAGKDGTYAVKPDPAAVVNSLGVQWSPDFDAYASGRISVGQVRCVLCRHAPCDCPPFGTPEYFALLDEVHGKSR